MDSPAQPQFSGSFLPSNGVEMMTEEEALRGLAIHEAGHAVIAHVPGIGSDGGVTIAPDADSAGHFTLESIDQTLRRWEGDGCDIIDNQLVYVGTRDRPYLRMWNSAFRARALVFMAGWAAEEVFLDESVGCPNDDERVLGAD